MNPMVRGLLGTYSWTNQTSGEEDTGTGLCLMGTVGTIIVEVEPMLNDRPLTNVSSDLSDAKPLTPSYLLYGRKIQMIPHTL